MYIVTPEPDANGGFVYMRRGSAGSRLEPADVDRAGVERCRTLVVSGIAQAISESAAAAVEHAARLVRGAGGIVVYDPNFRRRLSQARQRALESLLETAVSLWCDDSNRRRFVAWAALGRIPEVSAFTEGVR